jgi:hypothetical protein
MLPDPTTLFLSIVLGGLGLALFVYGKKQQRLPQLVAGLALMVFPYFVSGALALVGVGALIGGALWAVLQLGW